MPAMLGNTRSLGDWRSRSFSSTLCSHCREIAAYGSAGAIAPTGKVCPTLNQRL